MTAPAWQQVLAYAVTGRRFPELEGPSAPDLDAVAAFLEPRLGVDVDRTELRQPHPLPDDLAAGIGAAQLWAAVAELRERLGPRAGAARAVARARPLTADEQRLLREVPPHHGA